MQAIRREIGLPRPAGVFCACLDCTCSSSPHASRSTPPSICSLYVYSPSPFSVYISLFSLSRPLSLSLPPSLPLSLPPCLPASLSLPLPPSLGLMTPSAVSRTRAVLEGCLGFRFPGRSRVSVCGARITRASEGCLGFRVSVFDFRSSGFDFRSFRFRASVFRIRVSVSPQGPRRARGRCSTALNVFNLLSKICISKNML